MTNAAQSESRDLTTKHAKHAKAERVTRTPNKLWTTIVGFSLACAGTLQAASTIQFTASTYTVAEDAGAVTLTVQRLAATLYVSLESTNPIPPFASWETAATNIQNAVDAAKGADTVLVTNGVYAVGERDVSVLDTNSSPPQVVSSGLSRVVVTNSIRLESVNGPLTTTIVGGSATNEAGLVVGVRCVCLGSNAVLNGFTLTNGNAGCIDWGWSCDGVWTYGGGVWCDSTNAVLTNCVMVGNSAYYGGGGTYNGTLYNCTLTGNSAGLHGGGADCCTLYNCTLTGNNGG